MRRAEYRKVSAVKCANLCNHQSFAESHDDTVNQIKVRIRVLLHYLNCTPQIFIISINDREICIAERIEKRDFSPETISIVSEEAGFY